MEDLQRETEKERKAFALSPAIKMALCCLIPLVVLGVLAYSGFSLKGFGILAILLLCPLLHFLMMRGGHYHGRSKGKEEL
jgi:hypothetical protein